MSIGVVDPVDYGFVLSSDLVSDFEQVILAVLVSTQCAGPDAILPHHTLLPSLIEAHAHLFLDGAPVDFAQRDQYLKQPPEYMLARARARWPHPRGPASVGTAAEP